jgi:hypothetical protein
MRFSSHDALALGKLSQVSNAMDKMFIFEDEQMFQFFYALQYPFHLNDVEGLSDCFHCLMVSQWATWSLPIVPEL